MTIVFTDLVDSSECKRLIAGSDQHERNLRFARQVLQPYRERLQSLLGNGRIVSLIGDGHLIVFDRLLCALRFALELHHSLRSDPIAIPIELGAHLRCKIGMHVGEPEVDPDDPLNISGREVDFAARICAYARAGETLLSQAAATQAQDQQIVGVTIGGPRQTREELHGFGHVQLYWLE